MSKKHFDNYFKIVRNEFEETVLLANKMTELIALGKLDPDRLEAFEANSKSIIDNFHLINNIRLLLDRPDKKSKQAGYEKRMKNEFSKSVEFELKKLQQMHAESIDKIKDLIE